MMTLSNDPPTLDREATVHKYSKVFKEMIDICLQKDPQKRPTAEKLLSHPFFKQAKKKEYLTKSVLAHVPPLDQRPHKKVPQRHISFETTEQAWDFESDNEDAPQPKRHISFGDVIIRSSDKKPSRFLAAEESGEEVRKGRFSIASDDTPSPIPLTRVGSEQRKSRFEISDGTSLSREDSMSSSGLSRNNSTTSPKPSRFAVDHGENRKKGRFELSGGNIDG